MSETTGETTRPLNPKEPERRERDTTVGGGTKQ